MERIQLHQLERLTSAIDAALNCPAGTHTIEKAYGGYQLFRNNGSVSLLGTGYTTKRNLYDNIHSYLLGIYDAKTMTGRHV
jgi:hypothetical protein